MIPTEETVDVPSAFRELLPPHFFSYLGQDHYMPARYTLHMSQDFYGARLLEVPFEGPSKEAMETLLDQVDASTENRIPVVAVTAGLSSHKALLGTDKIMEYLHGIAMVIDREKCVITCQESRGMGIPLPLRRALQEYFPRYAIVIYHTPQQANAEPTCAFHINANLTRLRKHLKPSNGSEDATDWRRRMAPHLNAVVIDERTAGDNPDYTPDYAPLPDHHFMHKTRMRDAREVWKHYWGLTGEYKPFEVAQLEPVKHLPFLPTLLLPRNMFPPRRKAILAEYYPIYAPSFQEGMQRFDEYAEGAVHTVPRSYPASGVTAVIPIEYVMTELKRMARETVSHKDDMGWECIECPLPMKLTGLPDPHGEKPAIVRDWWRPRLGIFPEELTSKQRASIVRY